MTDISQDPQASREAEKYDNPIASREFLLDLMDRHGGPITFRRLVEVLEYEDTEQREALRRRLRAMERDGQAIRNRRGGYVPLTKSQLVRGRVMGHKDGFGFLIPDEGGDDVFLSAKQMRTLLHGDRAIVQIAGVDRRGRPEGAVAEVIERAHTHIVGHLNIESGVAFVVPDNKRISQDVMVPMDALGDAREGQIVKVELIEQPTFRSKPVGHVVEVLGDRMAPGMEIDIAINTHELPHEWPKAVKKEIAPLTDEVLETDKQGRIDLRHIPLVTIDGEDSKDFDDAVYAEATPKGWRLLVAIADVSHYVRPGTALDREAYNRGTSVYFPGQVVPMLPEILSNGLCSLNPHVERLCLACEMQINAEGKITRSRFFEGVMRSHARLTYNQVAAMVVDQEESVRAQHETVVPHLETLYELYRVLAKGREKRGAIEFETTETKVIFGKQRKIESIVPTERNDAHRLIEECMVAANVAAARYLKRNRIEGLYRVHDGPKEEKLEDLQAFLGEMALPPITLPKPSSHEFNRVLGAARGRPDEHLAQTVLLRSLQQAVYSPNNIGHFGLAHENYTHYTSPIRRYPDLIVHRAIRHVLRAGKPEGFPYSHEDMVIIGEHSSNCERRADEASRDAMDWLKCEFMLDKVGEEFDGVVTSVTGFGLFVELKDVYVEGLVHVTSLDKDFYQFDPVGHRMVGERSGKVFRLGDSIRVQVARVDLDDRKIDLVLPGGEIEEVAEAAQKSGSGAETEEEAPKKRKRRKKKPRSPKREGEKPAKDGKKKAGKKTEA